MAMTMEKTTSITVNEDDNLLDKPTDSLPSRNETPASNIAPPVSPASPTISTVSATSPFAATSPPTKNMPAPQPLITDPARAASSAQTSPIQSSPVQTSPTTPTASTTAPTGNTVNTISTQGTTHKTQAAFVNKLYTMVEDTSIQHLIAWAPSGDVFSVSNPTEFSKTVLPQYFKHNNWQSFVRQLNMYGFHKVNDMFHANPSSESQAWEFKHPEFRRGHMEALQHIKRKSSKPHPNANTMMKGGMGGTGANLGSAGETDAMRDNKIDQLSKEVAEITDRIRRMNENYSMLYSETVSCRMLQAKLTLVITNISKILTSMCHEEEGDTHNLSRKRKFDVDLLQAEVAKLGQNEASTPPPSSIPHYRDGLHPSQRQPSTPNSVVSADNTGSPHGAVPISDIDYPRSGYSASHSPPSQHRTVKIQPASPLAVLPDFSFPPQHYQQSQYSIRHRSPEPVTPVGAGNGSGSSSTNNNGSYRSPTPIPPPNQMPAAQTSQYRQTPSQHHVPSLPSPHRLSPQSSPSLSFGSDSTLLNPSDRHMDTHSPVSQMPPPQPSSQRSPTGPSSPSPSSYSKDSVPPATSRQSSLSDPSDGVSIDRVMDYKRRKRS